MVEKGAVHATLSGSSCNSIGRMGRGGKANCMRERDERVRNFHQRHIADLCRMPPVLLPVILRVASSVFGIR